MEITTFCRHFGNRHDGNHEDERDPLLHRGTAAETDRHGKGLGGHRKGGLERRIRVHLRVALDQSHDANGFRRDDKRSHRGSQSLDRRPQKISRNGRDQCGNRPHKMSFRYFPLVCGASERSHRRNMAEDDSNAQRLSQLRTQDGNGFRYFR